MGKSGKLKAPKPSSNLLVPKSAASDLNYNDRSPVFCFQYLDPEFGLKNCTDMDKTALVERLVKLSCMTWSQIQKAPRHGLGTELIPIRQLRRPKPSFLSQDTDALLAFRFHGLAPMLGHRAQHVFHICFLDAKFTLYDHG